MACRIAGMLGCGGGPPTLFFHPAALRRRNSPKPTRWSASVPDPSVFKSGRDFAAWLGLTPRQNSSGGKQTLGGITKQGNRYIRKLLVLGATSLLNVVGKRKGALRDWIVALLAKKPARMVTVALANKLARILWAMMKTGECFRTEMFAKA